MLTSDKERKICEKYSSSGEDGKVRCTECPLNKGDPNRHDFRCKANSSYDRRLVDWVYDDVQLEVD